MTTAMTETFSAWLEPIRKQLPSPLSQADAATFQKALYEEAFRRIEAFFSGIRAYQNHPALRQDNQDVRVLWKRGTTQLLDYAPYSNGPVVLIVPSLVNRFEILDIDPERSFLRFLASQGLHPIVVDWQEPGDEEKKFSISDYMTERLAPVLDLLNEQNGPCHLLGYCMGGMMSLALALLKPQQIKSLTLMATPWDFAAKGVGGVPPAHTPMGMFFTQIAEMWLPYLEKVGILPADFLQKVFTSFQPLQILKKFTRFTQMSSSAEETRRFVLTEDWLNNGVPLSLPVSKECLRDWYKDNRPAKRQWAVAGVTIDPQKINVPTYLLIAGKDRIVPPASSLPLAGLIRGVTLAEPMLGHIGLMCGHAAAHDVWKPLTHWLFSQEKPSA